MYFSEISIRFSAGRSTPAMRAIRVVLPVPGLALALLVAGVGGADDPHHALALDDLALVADLLDGRADLHGLPSLPGISVLPDEKPRRAFPAGPRFRLAERPA